MQNLFETTDNLPFETVRASIEAICGSFDIFPKRNEPKSWGGVTASRMAGIETAFIATNVQRVTRSEKNIDIDQNRNFFLIYQQAGRALMLQGDAQVMLAPGDLMLVDAGAPSEFVFFGNESQQASLHLPKSEVIKRCGTSVTPGGFLRAGDGLSQAFRSIIEQGFSPYLSAEAEPFLKDAIYNLVGAQFSAQSKAPSPLLLATPDFRDPLLERAIGVTDSMFRDPDFTVSKLADELNVTTRQLQRSFKKLSVTPTRYLMSRRLEYAREQIMKGASSPDRVLISQIAYSAGFSDLSYFNRRFREAFGATPGDIHKQAATPLPLMEHPNRISA